MKKIIFILAVITLTAACDLPDLSVGSMELSIGNGVSRTLLPDISMDPYAFSISGTGPEGHTFLLDTLKDRNVIEDLTPGDWLIEVSASNADGEIIGRGSRTIAVFGGETASAAITVTPLSGTGVLDLSLIWEPDDLSNAVISATLLPPGGTALSLDFIDDGAGSASLSAAFEAGYYTLLLQLLDTDTVVMGSAETVRIVAGETTSGFFDYTDVNSISGSGDIGIDVDLNEPIEIVLSGTMDTISYGSAMTVSAASPAETETISYDWYLNGFPLGNGTTVTVGSDLDPGIYRLDVIALNSDLSRSGSLNHTFTVSQP
ncbi:hypothetical protein [Spirochaeta isovalerica]|uniref:Uncharacterized protein n=1 Tax=Spirochaeta isovalerica TaxID=150 RepID=A0A841RAD4_9SPIO|nr:hypothetical protein [Spirochaeta isovalerica]MBB6480331.1 hypothetical protein [Spirochaeta isovalerica]